MKTDAVYHSNINHTWALWNIYRLTCTAPVIPIAKANSFRLKLRARARSAGHESGRNGRAVSEVRSRA
jgi:hypothetical protein